MPITIAGQALPASLPTDADARLLKATGCTAAEHAAMLRRSGVSAVQVARVLAPLVDKAAADLAPDIEAAGPTIVAAQLAPLLAASAEPAAHEAAE